MAILGGFLADRLGYAFAGGYEAALRVLLPSLPHAAIASFCATEEGGNQPRAIRTRLAPAGDGLVLDGTKRWSTMGPLASVLLVVATGGEDAAGRKRLRVVRVDAGAPGVTVDSMPPTAFVPEVPHAALTLAGVAVSAADLLPGDGYDRYVKPFRTVEDLHIHGALLGYLVGVSRRHGFPREATERLLAAVAASHELAALDPAAAETHVALAGLLAQDARLLAELEPAWAGVEPGERERWERDRGLLAVAGQARELRRQRAWERLGHQ